jgi:CheY-like chemotaxis protein
MPRIDDTPSGLKRTTQEVVEIRLWDIYLVRNRNNLYHTLSKFALDIAHLNPIGIEKVTFRFLQCDWDNNIQPMLTSQSIPFDIIRKMKVDVPKPLTKKKIYVAEDDLDILFALNTMLEDAGYDVLLSHCGSPVLQRNLPPTDLFILDKRMPDVDGLDVCRHLRAQASTKDVPVIMISAIRNFEDQALKAGANHFIEKPFQMNQLLQLVAKYTMATKVEDFIGN